MTLERVARRQSSFAAGELSPRALGRIDSPAYGRGLAQCRNWIINPQGSLPRRPGTKYIGTTKSLEIVIFTEQSNAKRFGLLGVAWASEISLFCAVGAADGTDAYLLTSPDGITWTEQTNPKNFDLNDVIWNGSLFVAVGSADGTDAYIVTSPDGTTWTERANPKNFALLDVAWDGSQFAAVGGPDGTDAYIVTSPDGTTWTEQSNPKNFFLEGVLWNGSVFVAVGLPDGTDAYIVTSPDGVTWTERENPKNFRLDKVAWNGSLLVAVGAGDGTDAYIITSPDGVTWTEQSNSKNVGLQSIVWSDSFFCAVGNPDGTDAYMLTSPDGETWTEQINPKNVGLRGITWNGNIFCTVGLDDGADSYLLTSPGDTSGRRLIAFPGSTGTPYMIEVGNTYFRFWRDGVQVESSPGTPLEVATPWNAIDLPSVQYAQAADVMYLSHPDFTPRKLVRASDLTFTLTDMQSVSSLPTSYLLKDGPYQAENTTTTTINPSGVTGSITLVASTSIFASTDVGRTVRIFQLTTEDAGEWGWLVITAFASATSVTATVMGEDLADSLAVTRWALGAFSATTGYPACVSFYQQRLMFAATDAQPQAIWGSTVFAFEQFQPTQFDDTQVADNGLAFTIASRRQARIRWLATSSSLIAGTASGPFIINGTADNASISPFSLNVRLASEYDASSVLPAIVGNVTVYAQSGGQRIRGLDPGQRDIYGQPDLTLLSDQVTQSGVKEMTYSAISSSILWMTRTDGKLIGLTIHQEAESAGWHLHTIGGSLTGSTEPKALSIANLPSEGFDQLYLIVRRTINGSDVEYIEALQAQFEDSDTGVDIEDAWHLDGAKKYDGPATTAITGLDHLEGETVKVFADGAMQVDQTVSSGAITIASAASVVLVGLGYDSDLQVVPLRFQDVPGAGVTPFGSIIEVYQTSGLQIGPDTGTLFTVPLDTGLNTKDVDASFEAPSAATITRPQYVIRSKNALPATILSLTHRMELETQN